MALKLLDADTNVSKNIYFCTLNDFFTLKIRRGYNRGRKEQTEKGIMK
jgi:hypothetical protein